MYVLTQNWKCTPKHRKERVTETLCAKKRTNFRWQVCQAEPTLACCPLSSPWYWTFQHVPMSHADSPKWSTVECKHPSHTFLCFSLYVTSSYMSFRGMSSTYVDQCSCHDTAAWMKRWSSRTEMKRRKMLLSHLWGSRHLQILNFEVTTKENPIPCDF